ncbi:MAG TPA: outer membrane lipoprotein carrier protein LolA [Desulfotomaculum sp.]|nr:outer membrane lipoprotein carrier protein LolA [Desulfotomaculum sp.]
MKRLLFSCMIMVFLVTGLAGCGGKEERADEQAAGKHELRSEETKPAGEESTADILAKGKNIEGMYYEYVFSGLPGGELGGKVWMCGKKMKTESTQGGQSIITIIDGDTNTVYTYYPNRNKATKITGGGETGPETQAPTDYTREVDPADIKVIEKRVVYEGVVCRVWQVKGQDGSETKMWVREDYGIPVRVEITAPDGTRMVMEYKNIKIGPIPAETFQLPAGVEVTDLTQVMEGLTEMMEGLPQAPGMQ